MRNTWLVHIVKSFPFWLLGYTWWCSGVFPVLYTGITPCGCFQELNFGWPHVRQVTYSRNNRFSNICLKVLIEKFLKLFQPLWSYFTGLSDTFGPREYFTATSNCSAPELIYCLESLFLIPTSTLLNEKESAVLPRGFRYYGVSSGHFFK